MISDIFDAVIALEQAGGSEELARELFTMLLNELPEHKQAISHASEVANSNEASPNRLWDSVHKLHGACAYLGVPALLEAAKSFENTIKLNNRAKFGEDFQRLESEINRLLEQGQDILKRNW